MSAVSGKISSDNRTIALNFYSLELMKKNEKKNVNLWDYCE
jgi:hypothetical protein